MFDLQIVPSAVESKDEMVPLPNQRQKSWDLPEHTPTQSRIQKQHSQVLSFNNTPYTDDYPAHCIIDSFIIIG